MSMVGFLLLATLASTGLTIDVDRPLLPTLRCAQAVITGQGESIIRIDEEQGLIMTGLRHVGPEILHDCRHRSCGGGNPVDEGNLPAYHRACLRRVRRNPRSSNRQNSWARRERSAPYAALVLVASPLNRPP